jgi:hypothetical protein
VNSIAGLTRDGVPPAQRMLLTEQSTYAAHRAETPRQAMQRSSPGVFPDARASTCPVDTGVVCGA